MYLSTRLKEERERLKYNQTAFAALADASKQAQINWEKGVATPNATALAAWAEVGLDVLYVVTGKRDGSPLDAGKRVLLSNYDRCDADGQVKLIQDSALLAAGITPTSQQAASTPTAPTHQTGGAHSQHNSGDNAVQIGGTGGSVTIGMSADRNRNTGPRQRQTPPASGGQSNTGHGAVQVGHTHGDVNVATQSNETNKAKASKSIFGVAIGRIGGSKKD